MTDERTQRIAPNKLAERQANHVSDTHRHLVNTSAGTMQMNSGIMDGQLWIWLMERAEGRQCVSGFLKKTTQQHSASSTFHAVWGAGVSMYAHVYIQADCTRWVCACGCKLVTCVYVFIPLHVHVTFIFMYVFFLQHFLGLICGFGFCFLFFYSCAFIFPSCFMSVFMQMSILTYT